VRVECTVLYIGSEFGVLGRVSTEEAALAVKCWASALGDCSNIQSREHYISKGMWPGDSITMEGIWDEPRTVGIDSLTVRSLCRTHNTALGPLDESAKLAFAKIGEAFDKCNYRSRNRRHKFKVIETRLDGLALERWALKFFIGSVTAWQRDLEWYPDMTPPLEPPLTAVRATFGLESLTYPAGLYCTAQVGDQFAQREGVGIEIRSDGGAIIGARFHFRGIEFIIWLGSDEILRVGSDFVMRGTAKAEPNMMYHLKEFKIRAHSILSNVIHFDWPLHISEAI